MVYVYLLGITVGYPLILIIFILYFLREKMAYLSSAFKQYSINLYPIKDTLCI